MSKLNRKNDQLPVGDLLDAVFCDDGQLPSTARCCRCCQPILEEEFHWTDNDYGSIIRLCFRLFYAVSMLFAGRFVDRVGTKKGYAWSICRLVAGRGQLHAVCGVVTERG